MDAMPTAAQQLVGTLRHLGVDRVFCIPGESYLPALDALANEPGLDLVTCRHESGAGLMAATDAKLTGRPGVAFVSRGPGATNAALAVHTAEQDAAPLVLFVGQLPRRNLERGVFQKLDYVRTFRDLAKHVVEVHDAPRLAATVVEAFHIAMDGTQGPVIVSIPEDVFDEHVGDALPELKPRETTCPTVAEVTDVAYRLRAAERPLLLVGGEARSATGRTALAACASSWQVPVATSYKHQDLFDNDDPGYAGHLGFGLPPAAWQHLTEADLIVAVGTRLNEITTQGFRLPTAQPRRTASISSMSWRRSAGICQPTGSSRWTRGTSVAGSIDTSDSDRANVSSGRYPARWDWARRLPSPPRSAIRHGRWSVSSAMVGF
jgi:acetolactate synthase-1/2/3 large subunit